MYKYIKQWPVDRENGWSHELNGVCHDKDNWYFTQNGKPGPFKMYEKGILWKFPITHRLANKVTSQAPPNILCYRSESHSGSKKLHYGDIDCINGFIFVPVTGDSHPYIQVFTTKDLTPVARQELKRPYGKYFDSIAWCAINPNDERLYTSDRHISSNFDSHDHSPFLVYDIDFNKIRQGESDFLTYRTCLIPLTGNRKILSYDHIQGGCFDNECHLHTTNGNATGLFEKKYCNSNGGIFVFQIPNAIDRNVPYMVERIAQSNQSKGFRFQFNGRGDEPEGITYWNLNKDNRAPNIKGVLHAIMINNDDGVTNPDDFYFKHYDRT